MQRCGRSSSNIHKIVYGIVRAISANGRGLGGLIDDGWLGCLDCTVALAGVLVCTQRNGNVRDWLLGIPVVSSSVKNRAEDRAVMAVVEMRNVMVLHAYKRKTSRKF